MNILCGDIGGTKCLLALSVDGELQQEKRYESKAFPEFVQVVKTFLGEVGARPERACFAIAGPVADDRCKATNLPWVIDARALQAELDIARIRLVNDFYAQALAVLQLGADDLTALHAGSAVQGGPIAVLGAGTGLGEAFLFHGGTRYEVVASEGGHSDFAPATDRQIELLRYLRDKLGGRVSYERLLSGAGLVNIFSFLRDRGHGEEHAEVREAMGREDPAAVISRFANLPGAQRDALCDATMTIFCEIYGQEAGNLGLKMLATGGIYVCGGVGARNVARMKDGTFERAFADKGRLSPLVKAMPVWLVTNVRSGLVGAAVAATRM